MLFLNAGPKVTKLSTKNKTEQEKNNTNLMKGENKLKWKTIKD